MKILVFGAREWGSEKTIYRILSKLPEHTTLVNGTARGADQLARLLGQRLGFEIRDYPADWETHGKSAGPIRNAKMITEEHPDKDGVFIDKAFGFSTGRHNRGTHDMAQKLWESKIRFEIFFP